MPQHANTVARGLAVMWLLNERVFNCYNPFETRKDYKEIFLAMWTNHENLTTSFVGQYFKADCYVLAVTMATLKVHR